MRVTTPILSRWLFRTDTFMPSSILTLSLLLAIALTDPFRANVTKRRDRRGCRQCDDPGDHDIAGNIPAHCRNLSRCANANDRTGDRMRGGHRDSEECCGN